MTTTESLQTITHWIDGHLVDGAGETLPVLNPATGETLRHVELGTQTTVDVAVASAAAAAGAWGETPATKRSRLLASLIVKLNEHRDEFVRLMGEEHGKVVSDAVGEFTRGVEVVEHAMSAPTYLKGEYSDQVASGVDVHSIRRPLGVVGIITPFNFPLMVPLWLGSMALACGNSVVLKPSEQDPSCSILLAQVIKEAGFPDGVFNVVNGAKDAVNGILDAPEIEAVSFVGSTAVAQHVYERGSIAGKRIQAFGGAKNHMIVLPDADLATAADAAVSAAFGSSGQRCMAISALVTVGDVAERLVPAIVERIGKLRTGPATDVEAELGPVISSAAHDRIKRAIGTAAQEGADLVVDGRGWAPDGHEDGYFVAPTLIDNVTRDMRVYIDEIFGPVLSILRVETYDEALELLNSNPYGNGAAIFTSSGAAARRFEREATAGTIGVNVPIPMPVAAHSFGGWKASRFGDLHMSGPDGFKFYTRNKVMTSRWPTVEATASAGVNLAFGS